MEVSDAQSPGDEPIPDVPAEFTGEVSGFTENSPEAINAEGAQVEGGAGEEQPSVDTEVEVEAAIEPFSEAPAELPDVSVQADQSESLAEEAVGAQDFGVVDEGTVFINVESPGEVPCAGALSSEMETQVPVAPAREAQVPESSEEATVSGDSLVTKLQDISGRINVVIGEVVQGFSQIEALKSALEAAQRRRKVTVGSFPHGLRHLRIYGHLLPRHVARWSVEARPGVFSELTRIGLAMVAGVGLEVTWRVTGIATVAWRVRIYALLETVKQMSWHSRIMGTASPLLAHFVV
ncbi:hypothetical protein Nepgr_030261 [Nepenthes gracilis]|uniref:Uncharacterized protein n=1 Tax=Nepenthes gracilis TaxID=150966 RepID=A0AAD3TG55_NEPGR|nr:hypothetical protein Nepgr_030261 [Nepenthes gracilis]